MLLMTEKGIRGGISLVNKKNLKDCDEIKNYINEVWRKD